MNHKLSDSQLEAMIKSAVNSSGPLPPDEKFSQLISALRELQERRKAAMDSEPVADVVAWSHPTEERTCDVRLRRHDVEPGPLYRHAQPAPVVPEDVRQALSKMDDEIIAELDAEESACRAAMLAAAPQELKK